MGYFTLRFLIPYFYNQDVLSMTFLGSVNRSARMSFFLNDTADIARVNVLPFHIAQHKFEILYLQ